MKPEHRDIQAWIRDKYSDKYKVQIEIESKNRLPNSGTDWYQPDVVIRDNSEDIKYIIEIEGDPVRKSLVGASILADASIARLKQKIKPKLIFVIYDQKGIKQIHNFLIRTKIVLSYCVNIDDILIRTEDDFKRMNL